MFDPKASCRRIMAAYRGERADRVPMCSPISWQPSRDIDREKPGGWRADADFIRVARLVQEHCDPVIIWNPVPYPQLRTRFGYQRFLEAPDELVIEKPVEVLADGRRRHTFILPTSRGDLTWIYDETEGIETSWDMRKPVEKPEDVEALLSVPFALKKPAHSEYEAFRRYRREMGREAFLERVWAWKAASGAHRLDALGGGTAQARVRQVGHRLRSQREHRESHGFQRACGPGRRDARDGHQKVDRGRVVRTDIGGDARRRGVNHREGFRGLGRDPGEDLEDPVVIDPLFQQDGLGLATDREKAEHQVDGIDRLLGSPCDVGGFCEHELCFP